MFNLYHEVYWDPLVVSIVEVGLPVVRSSVGAEPLEVGRHVELGKHVAVVVHAVLVCCVVCVPVLVSRLKQYRVRTGKGRQWEVWQYHSVLGLRRTGHWWRWHCWRWRERLTTCRRVWRWSYRWRPKLERTDDHDSSVPDPDTHPSDTKNSLGGALDDPNSGGHSLCFVKLKLQWGGWELELILWRLSCVECWVTSHPGWPAATALQAVQSEYSTLYTKLVISCFRKYFNTSHWSDHYSLLLQW